MTPFISCLGGRGYPGPAERIAYLREEIDILKSLWTQEATDYDGKYYVLKEATNNPKPFQTPHPPVWVGLVMGRHVMPKVAAEQADAINVYNASDVAAGELLDLVKRHCDTIGRDYHAIPKSRSVNVIITDGSTEVPAHVSAADGSFQHVIGSTEERAQDQSATLDEQFARVKAATEKHDVYSRLTERHVVGSPAQIAEELVRISGDTFDQVIVHGLNSTEALTQFAEEILPLIRKEG
jgi:alkanesulfonate monooxygenase SsuD/methylene tetrahydromethanopterin reductase-like flavin-dependent oxidoreductase (luciferase family)